MMLPTKIRSIKQPGWTDELRWTSSKPGQFVADVDHDWRVWTTPVTGRTVVKNKGWMAVDEFPTLDEALAFLDYRIDA